MKTENENDAQEPVACMVETEQGVMTWPIACLDEARSYCDEGEEPELLCRMGSEPAKARALRLADDAAESVICTEGHSPAAYHWVLTHEQIAADPYLEDCIAHLEWRGIARRFDAEDGVTVIFEEQP